VRSACSTARASSTRFATPTFRKMLRLHRLLAEEELGGDLGVGLAVDDEPRELELALGERADPAEPVSVRRPAVDALAELAQLLFCLRPVAS
jgi:hypothetical protein